MNLSKDYLQNADTGIAPTEAELVVQHAELVKRIAYHLLGRLPASVEVDDLIQAGMIGLISAARNFSPDKGASFETYAGIRVRGAMLDEVRKSDWTPRSVHRKIREVSEAIAQIEHETGTSARDVDVADKLGLDMAEYQKVVRDATAVRLLSLDAPSGEDETGIEIVRDLVQEPLSQAEQADQRRGLIKGIDALPDRERTVLSLYYDDELNMREIGEVLGVTESRVCQIHGQALLRLRSKLVEF